MRLRCHEGHGNENIKKAILIEWAGFLVCFSFVFCGVRDTAAWKLNRGQRRNQWGHSMQLYLWLYETHTHKIHTKNSLPSRLPNMWYWLWDCNHVGERWVLSLLTAPSLLSLLCYNKTWGLKYVNKTLEISQNNSLYTDETTVEPRKHELGWLDLDLTPLFSHFYMVSLNSDNLNSLLTQNKFPFPWSKSHWKLPQ